MKANVESAIRAARRGDGEPLAALPKLGAAVVPHLVPYLSDPDVSIRRLVVSVFSAIGGRPAAGAVADALRDKDPDIQERAAAAVYQFDRPGEIVGDARHAEALRASVEGSNHAAAAVLLLGYAPGQASLALLRKLERLPPERRTKLHPWAEAVPVSLVATVASSRLGDGPARLALLEALEHASTEVYAFLLGVVRDIDDPSVLHALAKALHDDREIGGGVPSVAEPRRRVCDAAVDALADRLRLPVRFARKPAARYGAQEIEEVRKLIRTSIPS